MEKYDRGGVDGKGRLASQGFQNPLHRREKESLSHKRRNRGRKLGGGGEVRSQGKKKKEGRLVRHIAFESKESAETNDQKRGRNLKGRSASKKKGATRKGPMPRQQGLEEESPMVSRTQEREGSAVFPRTWSRTKKRPGPGMTLGREKGGAESDEREKK